jgi:hypothetical protein
MRLLERVIRTVFVLGVFALAANLALHFGTGGLWKGLGAAHAVTGATISRVLRRSTRLST